MQVANPRGRKLVARWLWNADAVSRWESIYAGNPNAPPPEWWSQKRENETPRHRTNAGEPMPFDRFIGEFCGQGRQIGYSGLAYAVMSGVYDGHGIDRRMHSTREIARQARAHLRAHRPGSWWILSLTTLAIVWLEIGMAVMLSFNTPTVGLACRSGSYLIFGLLSTVPWVLHCLPSFQRPGIWKKTVCHAFSLLSNLAMMLTIFAAVSLAQPEDPRCSANASMPWTVQWLVQQLHLQERVHRVHGFRERRLLPQQETL